MLSKPYMKKESRNKIRRAAIKAAKITAIIVVILVIAYFAFRNMVLQKVVTKIQDKTLTEYNSTFSVKEAKFRGICGIDMTDVTLKPNNADTLFRIESIQTDINMMKLLVGDIQLEGLQLKNGFLQLVKK